MPVTAPNPMWKIHAYTSKGEIYEQVNMSTRSRVLNSLTRLLDDNQVASIKVEREKH